MPKVIYFKKAGDQCSKTFVFSYKMCYKRQRSISFPAGKSGLILGWYKATVPFCDNGLLSLTVVPRKYLLVYFSFGKWEGGSIISCAHHDSCLFISVQSKGNEFTLLFDLVSIKYLNIVMLLYAISAFLLSKKTTPFAGLRSVTINVLLSSP